MPRLVVPGFAHHITQRGGRKQKTFFEESDYAGYIRRLMERLSEVEISIWAYCLMPNHVHFVAVPRTEDALRRLFGYVHAQYARATNKAHDWQGHLWQERFFSTVMDERHTVAAMRYVELNPVRAGLCKTADEWLWSSARAHLGLAHDPLLDLEATARVIDDWSEYLDLAADAHVQDKIRSATRTGRPAGGRVFIEMLEEITGRNIRAQKGGRPPKQGNCPN